MSITSNIQLIHYAQKIGVVLNGVVSKTNLPYPPQSGGYIINLADDKSSEGFQNQGTHWVAVYVEGKHTVYFDSFGLPPPANIQLWLKHLQPIYYSSVQIQNERGGFCGLYCLYFLYYLQHHRKNMDIQERLEKFQQLWHPDVTENLNRLKHYLRHL